MFLEGREHPMGISIFEGGEIEKRVLDSKLLGICADGPGGREAVA